MADEQVSKEDQTEDPSERKLEEGRREGDVPVSREVALVAALIAGAAGLYAQADHMVSGLVAGTREAAGHLNDASIPSLLSASAEPVGIVLLIIAGVVAAASGATFVQTGAGLWLNRLTPNLGRLFSLERLTHAFTRDGLVDLGVAALKSGLLLGIAWVLVMPALAQLRVLHFADSGSLLSGAWEPLRAVVPPLGVALVALMALDAFIVIKRFRKKMGMTKDAMRREQKEEEGDPRIKATRRKKYRDLVQGRVAVEVPRADALVVNPTHVAVAIRYRKKNDKAPRVTAKGQGQQAQLMRELAVQNGVPIVRDVPLARFLHKKVKVGRQVPSETYRAVAAVLAYVYKVTGRVPGTGGD